MKELELNKELNRLVHIARDLGYKLEKPQLFIDPVYGSKLAYYMQKANKIVIDEHFSENADKAEVLGTLAHEVAHAVAEQNNENKKSVWHGDEWEKACKQLGGNGERFHKGTYQKPPVVKKSMQELFKTQPKHPATRWERGTFKQWLSRGYHVMKGQKGELSFWQFVGAEFETYEDGKTHTGLSTAKAVYFTPEQVERNKA